MATAIRCPAGEAQHPVLSPNPLDVECRIAGRLQPAKGSPCCGDYWKCGIWRKHKENDWEARTVKVSESQRARANHVLSGA